MRFLKNGVFSEKLVESQVTDEDKIQTTIESLDRLPDIYPEGKPMIYEDGGSIYLAIMRAGKWMRVELMEV